MVTIGSQIGSVIVITTIMMEARPKKKLETGTRAMASITPWKTFPPSLKLIMI